MRRSTIIYHRDGRAIMLGKPNYDGDWQGRYFAGATWRDLDAFTIFGDEDGVTPQGIHYSNELANINGVHMTLFPDDTHSAEAVLAAKAWLRHRRDVVGFSIRWVKQWVEAAPVA